MDADALDGYRRAGRIAAEARELGASLVAPGVRLFDVATRVEAFVAEQGAALAAPCCLSIGDEAAHYSPRLGDEREFQEGDLVKVDVSVHVDGWIADNAMTLEVSTDRHRALIDAARAATDAAVAAVRPGGAIADASGAAEQALLSRGVRPVSNLTGHNILRHTLHGGVHIPSVAAQARGTFEPGMALAIEPFATAGVGEIRESGEGNIYRLLSPKPQRDPLARKLLDHVRKTHPSMPFPGRALAGVVPDAKLPYALRLLERSGALLHYGVLREVSGAPVAQFEHTVLVLEDEVVVTTRL